MITQAKHIISHCLISDTCQMTLPNSNELATGTVKLVDDVYECEFEKRAYTDIANNQVHARFQLLNFQCFEKIILTIK